MNKKPTKDLNKMSHDDIFKKAVEQGLADMKAGREMTLEEAKKRLKKHNEQCMDRFGKQQTDN